ncbi:MAG: hypothetical protein ACRC0Q_07010 [Kurthia gibsonii]|uniref:Uncharacterized protein n=1 Tax=Kurthia gibsonii TaxID=33946 RepID=A0ABU9LMH0_9BACL|nr:MULTISPECIES: hypothetical protein [Kurthia]AMA64176.1 putative membrane protein [Kurthia sp. 11kri321]MEB6113830.1 hypothetical protein [Kurthia gibsonii]WIL38653.1 hypothetical protein QN089_15390 [Kurthia sp. YJT4]
MNFKQLSLGKKIILITTVIALISLFLPWVELGILSASGFQQGGYLFLIAFIYPVYCVLKNTYINKVGGLVCGIVALIASIAYISSKSDEIFGTAINVAGSGAYLFLISTIGLIIGVVLDKRIS